MTIAPAPDPARTRRSAPRLAPLAALCTTLLAACSPDASDTPNTPAVVASSASPAAVAETLAAARALFGDGALVEARAEIEAHLAAHGEDGTLLVLFTEIQNALGHTDAAVASGERAVALAPRSSAAHLHYSRALASRMRAAGLIGAMRTLGTYKDALRRARELDPANLDARTDEIVFHLAAPGVAGGSTSRGRALADELVALDRERGLPLLIWAISADEGVDAAIEHGNAALADTPDDRGVRLALARMLAEEERVAEAVPHFERVLDGEEDEDYYDALYQLARLRVRTGIDAELAVSALEEYAADAPRAPQLPPPAAAWWRIGNARELLSDAAGARAAYETALSLDPDFEQAAEALDELD